MVKEVKDKTSSTDSSTMDFTFFLLNPANSDQARIWICTPFWPEAYLRDAEGKSHALLIKIHDGEKDHLWPMPRRLVANWTELNQALLDFGMITPTSVSNQKHLQSFLMSIRPEKKLSCVDKAYWHGNQYVFPDGLVIGRAKPMATSEVVENVLCELLQDIKPQNAIEGMLCAQLAVLHFQGIQCLGSAEDAQWRQHIETTLNYAIKLLRLQHETIETLMKYRRKGEQGSLSSM